MEIKDLEQTISSLQVETPEQFTELVQYILRGMIRHSKSIITEESGGGFVVAVAIPVEGNPLAFRGTSSIVGHSKHIAIALDQANLFDAVSLPELLEVHIMSKQHGKVTTKEVIDGSDNE